MIPFKFTYVLDEYLKQLCLKSKIVGDFTKEEIRACAERILDSYRGDQPKAVNVDLLT